MNETVESPSYKFSYYKKPIKNLIPDRSLSIEELHRIITSTSLQAETEFHRTIGDDKEAAKHKAQTFDYVTPNGIFNKREEKSIRDYSGFFIVDIDKQENLSEIRKKIIADELFQPVLVFTSPSGKGLKIFIRVDPSSIDKSARSKKMSKLWKGVNAHFKKDYHAIIAPDAKGNYIDDSGCDLSRACFVCYDPDAYLNTDAALFVVRENQQSADSSHKETVAAKTTAHDLAERHLSKTENHTPELVAFAAASEKIGISKEATLQYLTENIPIMGSKSDPAALNKLVEDVYNRYPSRDIDSIRLTQLQFSYGILLFKFAREAKGFVLSSLYSEGVRQILHDAGFAKRYTSPTASVYIRQTGCVIAEVSTEQMRDYMTRFVEAFSADVSFKYQDIHYQIPYQAIREVYLKNSNNIFNEVWLEHLQTHDIKVLKDSKTETFLFFRNVLVTVTKSEIRTTQWNAVKDYCIWEQQQIPYDFEYIPENNTGHFARFFYNINNNDAQRVLAMSSGIGYLMNYHFRPSAGQAVILYDEAITDTKSPMGGTGKGLLANALKQLRHVTKIDGKHLDSENRFRYEGVTPSTQLIWFDDTKPDFDATMLFSNLTDGWTIERKHLSQFQIPVPDSPKVLICSNAIIKGFGTSHARRMVAYELSDHYSRQIINGNEAPIEREHNGMFFSDDWSGDEWNKFFSFMCDCAQQYHVGDLIIAKSINIELNRLKQTTNDDFVAWAEGQNFEVDKKNYTRTLFDNFFFLYYGAGSNFHQRTFTNWLKAYAKYKGWEMLIGRAGQDALPVFTFKIREGAEMLRTKDDQELPF